MWILWQRWLFWNSSSSNSLRMYFRNVPFSDIHLRATAFLHNNFHVSSPCCNQITSTLVYSKCTLLKYPLIFFSWRILLRFTIQLPFSCSMFMRNTIYIQSYWKAIGFFHFSMPIYFIGIDISKYKHDFCINSAPNHLDKDSLFCSCSIFKLLICNLLKLTKIIF